MASDDGEAAAEARSKLSLVDLPIETQRQIFAHVRVFLFSMRDSTSLQIC